VNPLDEGILGDDQPLAELRRIVSDAPRETAALQLGEQAELTELREPHRWPLSASLRRGLPE
jgi:hypothetical protein